MGAGVGMALKACQGAWGTFAPLVQRTPCPTHLTLTQELGQANPPACTQFLILALTRIWTLPPRSPRLLPQA